MRPLLLAVVISLCGCAPALRGTAWDHSPEDCWQEHPNGIWEVDHCRDGKGVLAWVVWTM